MLAVSATGAATALYVGGQCDHTRLAPQPPPLPAAPHRTAQDSFADGAVAQDLTQLHSMWSLREHAPLAASLAGYTYKYDVSVPVRDFKALADETRRRLRALPSLEAVAEEVKVVAYGHLGDGNLHLNVCVPAAAGEKGGRCA